MTAQSVPVVNLLEAPPFWLLIPICYALTQRGHRCRIRVRHPGDQCRHHLDTEENR